MQKIKSCLWLDGNAKEMVDYYISVFPKSNVTHTMYYPNSTEEGLADFQKDMAGKELVIDFELNGQSYMALNAGPKFKFNEAVSFVIVCKDQDEINYYWEKLSSVPTAEQCGWCKDRFGLSWQVVPEHVGELLKRPGAYANMMKMKKLIIDEF
jgi:predicted 3-demethylubiquinone-9 3-methyltransferase (glyoxalase superfamily)